MTTWNVPRVKPKKKRDKLAPELPAWGWCVDCQAFNFHRVDCPLRKVLG